MKKITILCIILITIVVIYCGETITTTTSTSTNNSTTTTINSTSTTLNPTSTTDNTTSTSTSTSTTTTSTSTTTTTTLSFTGDIVYVTTNGNDTNIGTIDYPVQTISTGISKAISNSVTNVYIQEGTYNNNISLVSGLKISGGWNSNFTEASNYCTLTGNYITGTNITNAMLEGFWISGNTTHYGITLYRATNCLIHRVVLSNNVGYPAGGIHLTYGVTNVMTNFKLCYNTNTGVWNDIHCGGGMTIINSISNRIVAFHAFSNDAYYGGFTYASNCTNNFIWGYIYTNTAGLGAGYYIYRCISNDFSGLIFSNIATGGVNGGVYRATSETNQYGALWDNVPNNFPF